MKPFVTLVRREFWEHRMLWIVPLAMAACVILLSLLATGVSFHGGARVVAQSYLLLVGAAQLVVVWFVIVFYALDCLNAERRDRSILFWKSLPVSDASTVLSKFAVAILLVPVGAFVVVLATNVLVSTIFAIRLGGEESGGVLDATAWLDAHTIILRGVLSAMLWYAPLIAYLMFVSAWARRNVLLWAILPPIAAALLEKLVFGTSYVLAFLDRRLQLPNPIDRHVLPIAKGEPGSVGLTSFGFLEFLQLPGTWLGLLAAALLLFGATRIRRYRDDS